MARLSLLLVALTLFTVSTSSAWNPARIVVEQQDSLDAGSTTAAITCEITCSSGKTKTIQGDSEDYCVGYCEGYCGEECEVVE